MDNLGEAAKLYVYLKMAEMALGLILLPFFLYYFFTIFRRIRK